MVKVSSKVVEIMNLKSLLILITALCCYLSFSQRKYTVKATSGLVIRQGPSIKTERVGKLPYNHKFNVEEHNVADKFSLTENGIEIKGNWVEIESKFGNGYVFDGFTSRDYDVTGYSYALYGKVKSCKDYTFYNGGMQNADWREFNKKGELIKDYYHKGKDVWEISTHKIYNDKGQLIQKNGRYDSNSYKFDDGGNEVEDYEVKKDGTPYSKTIRTYDKKGNLTSVMYYYFKDKKAHKWTYSNYNNKNKYLEAKYYNHNNELDKHYKYTYKNDTILMVVHKVKIDGTKQIYAERTFKNTSEYTIEKFIKYKTVKEDGKIYKSELKKYDKNNNLIEEEFFDSAESQFPNISFSGGGGNYDERIVKQYTNNKLVSEKLYREIFYKNKFQEVLVHDFIYKKNYSKEINYTHYSDTVEKNVTINYYNYNSQLVKYIEYDNNNKDVFEYKYTYDRYGNWVLKKLFRNGKFYRDYIQEFEYYE